SILSMTGRPAASVVLLPAGSKSPFGLFGGVLSTALTTRPALTSPAGGTFPVPTGLAPVPFPPPGATPTPSSAPPAAAGCPPAAVVAVRDRLRALFNSGGRI